MLNKTVFYIGLAALTAGCNFQKDEIKSVTYSFSDPLTDRSSGTDTKVPIKTREYTVLTMADNSEEKLKEKKTKKIRAANKKQYEIDGDRWGDGRKSNAHKHYQVPGANNSKGIPVFSWTTD